MANHEEKKSKVGLYVVIALIIIILVIIACLVLNKYTISTNGGIFAKSIKDEVINADNYEEISNRIGDEIKDEDEVIYYSYACMYYIFKDGFSEEYLTAQDDSLLYKNIYNKTVKELINEGKQLMKDNNITVEEYKQQLENVNNSINEFNDNIN